MRPASARSTASPRTWTSRTRTSALPGISRSIMSRPTGPPRRLPVTTVPRPRTANTRSMASRGWPSNVARDLARSASVAIAARTSSKPSPVVADATSTGAPARVVRSSSPRVAAMSAARRSASDARSAFVTTAIPSVIASASRSSRCSSVWAFGPSSAATTSSAASISPAPTSMLPTSRSWPGTSTKSTISPSGSARCAYPTSIVMPRRRSSGSRSASIPVSARRSVVLPWSMWPAVPMTTLIAARRVRPARPAPRRAQGRASRRRRARPSARQGRRPRPRSAPRRPATLPAAGRGAGQARTSPR